MDLPDEHEFLPYHLKGLEIDELKELIQGCGFLSDTGCSVNISFIADSMRRRTLLPASNEQPALTEVRLTFTASVSHCPFCGATCSSLSQQLEGTVIRSPAHCVQSLLCLQPQVVQSFANDRVEPQGLRLALQDDMWFRGVKIAFSE